MTGQIVAIQLKGRKRKPMIPVMEANAIPGIGLEGVDGHRGRNNRWPNGRRQVLVISAEILDAFGLKPGDVREQITTRGIDVMNLRPGDRLRIGEVMLEVTLGCTPCDMLEDIRPGLRDAMQGQRGMLFRIVQGGAIRIGDAIEVQLFKQMEHL